MPDPTQLLAFIAASAILGVTPGPDIIYVITRGAAQGPRAGIAAAAGLSTGIVAHTVLCVVGLSAILAASAVAFTVIKLAGAAYLVYLGVRMWLSRESFDLSAGSGGPPVWSIYRQSVLMNVLNPKVAIFFLAFLPQFVSPEAGPVAPQFALLGVIFMAVSFVVMGLAGLGGGHLRRVLARSERSVRAIRYAAGGVLVALGLRLAFDSRG